MKPPSKPKPVIHKREKILIVVYDVSDTTIVPVLSAIQAYGKSAKLKHEGWCSLRNAVSDFGMVLDAVFPSEAKVFEKLIKTLLPNLNSLLFGEKILNALAYDAIFDLSEDKARAIGYPTGTKLAQSYGILLGAEAGSLPDLVENLCTSYTGIPKILIDERVFNCVADMNILSPGSYDAMRFPADLDSRILRAFSYDIVLGPPSLETHLASALKKRVIEVSTDAALTKWSNPQYMLITDLTYEALHKGLKICRPQSLLEG